MNQEKFYSKPLRLVQNLFVIVFLFSFLVSVFEPRNLFFKYFQDNVGAPLDSFLYVRVKWGMFKVMQARYCEFETEIVHEDGSVTEWDRKVAAQTLFTGPVDRLGTQLYLTTLMKDAPQEAAERRDLASFLVKHLGNTPSKPQLMRFNRVCHWYPKVGSAEEGQAETAPVAEINVASLGT